jgi:eukaryotic-like serine/threonine-protein kinase
LRSGAGQRTKSTVPATLPSIPPVSNLYPGQRLDRYELLCPVAQGGMAQVWVARMQSQLGFQRLVAVKAILAQHAEDPQFQAMFLEEARIISSIRHPNVAQIVDLGQHGDALYHVLEWVEGDSLSSLRRRVHGHGHKLPLGIVLRAVADACAGLHAAHEITNEQGELLGVVHRDVSPANVLLSTAGEVKVIDFGVAKVVGRIGEETSAGVIKGKVAYMAPEQAFGRGLDRRADIWSAGAMLYQLLSGRVPYDAENQVAILHQLLQGNPPAPLTGVPAEVAEIAYTALSYRPEGRFATADEMHRALEGALVKHCGAVTSADVASYVETQLGERITRRRATIQRAIEAADKRMEIASEYETASTTESNLLPADLHTPSSVAKSAVMRMRSADPELEPPGFAVAPVTPDFDRELDVDRAVKKFGVHSRKWLVVLGCVALIALLAYAAYMVHDRLSMQATGSVPAAHRH